LNQKANKCYKFIYLFSNEGFPKTRIGSDLPSFHGGQVYYDGDCKYSCYSDGSCKTELLVDWANFANSGRWTSITVWSKCSKKRTSKFCSNSVSGCSNCSQIMDCEADDSSKDVDETYIETFGSCTCTILDENTFDNCPCCHGTAQKSRNGAWVQQRICSSASVPLTTLTALAGQKKQTLAEMQSGLQSWRQNNSRTCGPTQCWVRGKCCDLIGTKTGHRCPIHC